MTVTLFIFLLQSKVVRVFLLQLQEKMEKSDLSISYPQCIFLSNLAIRAQNGSLAVF